MNQVKCHICGMKCVKSGKTKAGSQRWLCRHCKTSLTHKIDNDSKEVNKYFSSDSDRKTTLSDGTSVWWWLRSPGYASEGAANVDDDGSVNEIGDLVYFDYGAVRPALWIDISNPES